MLKIISTSDGSHTLYNTELNENYHSGFGAINESRHIYIEAGLNYYGRKKLSIFELGFGTGLNALLSLSETIKSDRQINYVSIDNFPLSKEIYSRLNYPDLLPGSLNSFFSQLHESSWDDDISITDHFSLYKIRGDISEFSTNRLFDIIYFDAFGPDKQPEMWTFDLLEKIAGITTKGGIFVTYSAKGQLKRDLLKLGFSVEHLPGPTGKRQITRAIKEAE